MNSNKIELSKALDTCSAFDIDVERGALMDNFETYLALIQEWNRYATLVSIGDAENGLIGHCVDSISLAPYVNSFIEEQGGGYVDIGTGGGFPAIPLCILFPELQALLIERNTKKSIFLKKVIGKLGLGAIEVDNDSFGGGLDSDIPKLITSRAIEKPGIVMPEILGSLSQGDVYLCQSESIHELPDELMSDFGVVELEDAFSESGMRRNRLYQISPNA
jgi:16S rRNA (guanine(527)-N(7))-methyltransferase RsmG